MNQTGKPRINLVPEKTGSKREAKPSVKISTVLKVFPSTVETPCLHESVFPGLTAGWKNTCKNNALQQ
jgi:hypothetical protein